MKLLLIDAYALIYRSYYAFIRNPRVNSKGMNTSAIFGFINSLDDALRRLTPTHAAIAFDPAGPTFRHEAFPEYKAQREKTPEDIHASEPYIRRLIEARHIPLLEVARYEADDVIGTIATQAAQEQFDVYMMTPDKDYGQLVTDRIFQFRPRHGGDYETMGTTEVLAKYGLADVRQVVDLLGLMGDASDNIPGCPGVGEKTAQKLLTEFGSIERLLESTDQLKGALRTKIETHAEQIRFSKFLATIVTGLATIGITSNGQVSLLIPGEMLRDEYVRRSLHPKNLSRTIEDAATVWEPILPWTSAGAYMAGTLGVATLSYMPWAVSNWIAIFFAMLWGATGIGIARLSSQERERMLAEG